MALFNSYFSTPSNFNFGNDYDKEISMGALLIGLVGSVLIFINKNSRLVWKILSVALILLLGSWVYFGLIFSFGF
ncbi:MAG: hypothetical protein A3B99_01895 [Candidatus Yanofskybacteria bacterium RIFCSPHIGHO2_02_FULL_44_12b]|nr:MAG: hypothetical protein A3B99_01895 [Candidatus Yanofskybacteria bacterium RIFCSPHIGHO2_02_FULL_44_12b]